MKKILFLLISFSSVSISYGQIAKWLIPPVYDEINMANGGDLIITDSLDKKIIWSLSGVRLAITDDKLFSFEEGLAVTTKPGSGIITGFYNNEGTFIPLSGCNVTFAGPYFSDGYLLVQEGEFYRFVNPKGEFLAGQYEKACPFYNDYASCTTFANLRKKKDPYNLLITKDCEQVELSYGGKSFDNDDIEFISSVNDENTGIVVAKHKLFYFNGKNQRLTPVYARENETNTKNQAKLDNDLAFCFSKDTDSTFVLCAKCGKNDAITISFDTHLLPLSISFPDGEYRYSKKTAQKHLYDSPLRINKEGDKYGIFWDKEEILPPQLDEVITCFDDKAFVKLSGKCGMVQIIKDEDFKIKINKGNPIDFRHQKYETMIRLDLPKIISAYKTRIEVDPKSGCNVDMPSAVEKDTEFGNYIEYDCVLQIPDSLPDEMYGDSRNEITYPIHVVYEGLKSPIIPYKVKAWHYKYFNVDVNDAETSIQQGLLTFTVNINAERNQGEAVIPFNMIIVTDSLQWDYERLSETRYKCRVFSLKEGINNVIVQILEEGCPPVSFPFEVTYTKPMAKTKTEPEVKEDVKINKKTRRTPVTPVPHVDI